MSTSRQRLSIVYSFIGSWWVWEGLALALSIACMVAIAVILLIWQDRPLRHWKLFIQPNSLVAILTTISKTSLLVVLAETISEMKWQYFEDRQRTLDKLQYFDEASRGPWGSLMMILKVRGDASLASIGALLTIIALAIEPTAQQVLAFPSKTTVLRNSTASLGVAEQYHSAIYWTKGFDVGQNKSRLLTFMTLGQIGRPPQPDFSCPEYATSCRWPTYTTLSVSMSCNPVLDFSTQCSWIFPSNRSQHPYELFCTFDSADFLSDTSNDFAVEPASLDETFANLKPDRRMFAKYSLAANYTRSAALNQTFYSLAPSAGVDGFAIYSLKSNVTWNGSEFPIEDYNISEKTPIPRARIERCIFHWCERQYADTLYAGSDIQLGPFSERPLDNHTRIDNNYLLSGSSATGIYRIHLNSYNVPRELMRALAGRSEVILNYGDNLGGFQESVVTINPPATPLPDVLRYRDFRSVLLGSQDAFNAQLRSLSMDNVNATTLAGDALLNETYIEVRWPWLILPAVETFLAAVLLSATVYTTRGRPLWKASAIALLYHGLEGWDDQELLEGELNNADDYTKGASEHHALLSRNNEGYMKFMRAYGPFRTH